MVILPDGSAIVMSWKQVKYINHDKFIVFQIIPMNKGKDIIIFPCKDKWQNITNVFSLDERAEIIFLLEHIEWKRDISIMEMSIEPYLNKELDFKTGMIESTKGYDILTKENLFDVDSKLDKEQVKNVYCKLEEKYAMSCKGKVVIPKETIIQGSINKEITIPMLKKNENVTIEIQ